MRQSKNVASNMSSKSSDRPKGDPVVVERIISTLKSRGCFDQFRKEFLADVDTKVVISFRGIFLSKTFIIRLSLT